MKKHKISCRFFKTSSTPKPHPNTSTYSLVFLIFQASLIKAVEFTFIHTRLALALDIDIDWKIICCQCFQYHWHNGLQAQAVRSSSLLYIKSHGLEDEF